MDKTGHDVARGRSRSITNALTRGRDRPPPHQPGATARGGATSAVRGSAAAGGQARPSNPSPPRARSGLPNGSAAATRAQRAENVSTSRARPGGAAGGRLVSFGAQEPRVGRHHDPPPQGLEFQRIVGRRQMAWKEDGIEAAERQEVRPPGDEGGGPDGGHLMGDEERVAVAGVVGAPPAEARARRAAEREPQARLPDLARAADDQRRRDPDGRI